MKSIRNGTILFISLLCFTFIINNLVFHMNGETSTNISFRGLADNSTNSTDDVTTDNSTNSTDDTTTTTDDITTSIDDNTTTTDDNTTTTDDITTTTDDITTTTDNDSSSGSNNAALIVFLVIILIVLGYALLASVLVRFQEGEWQTPFSYFAFQTFCSYSTFCCQQITDCFIDCWESCTGSHPRGDGIVGGSGNRSYSGPYQPVHNTGNNNAYQSSAYSVEDL